MFRLGTDGYLLQCHRHLKLTRQVGVVELIEVAQAFIRYELHILAAERVTVAGRKIPEGHPMSATLQWGSCEGLPGVSMQVGGDFSATDLHRGAEVSARDRSLGSAFFARGMFRLCLNLNCRLGQSTRLFTEVITRSGSAGDEIDHHRKRREDRRHRRSMGLRDQKRRPSHQGSERLLAATHARREGSRAK
jgi:hypothetical protein